MNRKNTQSIFKVVIVLVLFTWIAHAFEDDALLLENGNISTMYDKDKLTESGGQSLISKMIERGKILMNSFPRTGIQLAGSFHNLVPAPETINVGKNALIGLPRELIAYAVNSVCNIEIILIAFLNICIPIIFNLNPIHRQCRYKFECDQTIGYSQCTFDELSILNTIG